MYFDVVKFAAHSATVASSITSAVDGRTGASLVTCGDHPNEGAETLQETDVYEVPLRRYLWLLVPAGLGIAIGAALAHRAAGDPVVHATAAAAAAPARHADASPPRRVYRTARTRVGLTPLHNASALAGYATAPGLRPTPGTSRTATKAGGSSYGASVVTFDATPRSFAADAETATTFDTTTFDATTTTPIDTSTTPAPAVNTTPIVISDVHTTSLSPLSATIAFRTSEPVSGQLAYGLDDETLWTAWDAPSSEHVAVLTGLSYNMTYRLWVGAHAADGRSATSPFLLTTPALAGAVTGGTGGSALLVDGQPYFPTMVWGACQDAYDGELAAGIDLFMGKDCGHSADELGALANRGLLVTDAKDGAQTGAVGTFLPDEWDTHLPGDLTDAAARTLIPDNGGGARFLTLTNHFYSNAAPLPQGRGMYPALVANADVLGFDLYPLQNWCRYDDFGHVFDAQRELVALASGKPTFQWIEARTMDCHDPTLDPTADTIHAETWLAIAGGAHAIGYFPYSWSPEVGSQIALDKHEIQSLMPALLEPSLDAQGNGSVRVGAREHDGAIYVIAVNASRTSASATITVPRLGDRQLSSLDHSRSVTAANGAFADTFAPLEVRIYIAPPPAP
jgi:hypothetical protein